MLDPVAIEAVTAHHANQRVMELSWLVKILRVHKIERVLEIGCERGGTMWTWCQVADDGAQLLGIDREDVPLPAGAGHRGQHVKMARVDSQTPEALEAAQAFFDGPLDFLFIDGDHSAIGVRSDWTTFSPLVQNGGLVAFHDIDSGPSNGVEALWREDISKRYRTDEIHCELPGAPMGLGLVYL